MKINLKKINNKIAGIILVSIGMLFAMACLNGFAFCLSFGNAIIGADSVYDQSFYNLFYVAVGIVIASLVVLFTIGVVIDYLTLKNKDYANK